MILGIPQPHTEHVQGNEKETQQVQVIEAETEDQAQMVEETQKVEATDNSIKGALKRKSNTQGQAAAFELIKNKVLKEHNYARAAISG